MSSASVTEFYGLTQYVGTDKPSFTDNNEAFQKVDEDLHEVVQSAESQAEAISGLQESVGSLGDRVTAVEGDVADVKIDIGALQNKETLQDNAIAALKTVALDMICAYNEAAAQSTHAYAIGDYFRYNDVLYKATAVINIDDTIVPNVNCSATNVTEELLAIISAGAVDSTARAAIEALALEVGALADLTTTDKTSIVNAINELDSAIDDFKRSTIGTVENLTYQVDYVAPKDGYLLLQVNGTTTPQSAKASIDGQDIVFVETRTQSCPNSNSVFVRKGMTLNFNYQYGSGAEAKFFPIV